MSTFKMKRGDTKILGFAVIDIVGEPVDLNGAKLWFTAKHKPEDPDDDAVVYIDTDNGGVSVDSPTTLGTGTITIPATSTDSLIEHTLLYYDLQLKTSIGQIFTVDSGYLEVSLDITRSTV